MGIEPTSSAWKAEVLPLNYTRADDADLPAASGESLPPRHGWWRGKDSNLRRRKPADLQSAPVGRLGTPPQNEPRIVISEGRGVNASWNGICLSGGGLERSWLAWPLTVPRRPDDRSQPASAAGFRRVADHREARWDHSERASGGSPRSRPPARVAEPRDFGPHGAPPER